jgi:hypothetical protein
VANTGKLVEGGLRERLVKEIVEVLGITLHAGEEVAEPVLLDKVELSL